MKRIIARVPSSSKPGVEFNVALVEYGDRYGLDDCIVHDGTGRGKNFVHGMVLPPKPDSDALVEFYDTRYSHTEFGQFISRYSSKTLLNETDGYGRKLGSGLCLDTGVPAWSVDRESMLVVLGALCGAMGKVAKPEEW